MPIPNLVAPQSRLVAQLQNTGPARWMINITTPQAAPYFRAVASAYLQEQCNFLGRLGLVVTPSAMMHEWRRVGWRGPVVTSHQFLKEPAEPDVRYGTVVFDEQQMYSPRYLERLDAILGQDAKSALFWLPAKPEKELLDVLAKHRFVQININ